MTQETVVDIQWQPQPRQLKFLRACGLSHPFDGGDPRKPVAEVIGFGGAAGGGKSDSLLALAIIASLTFPKIQIGYFRRTFPQLKGSGGAIKRSLQLIPKSIAKYNATDHEWTFYTGGVLKFCQLQREDDVYNYMSNQFDILLFDEGTQFIPSQISYMQSRNRATIDGFTPFTAIATNPGNIGHYAFKTGFIDIGDPEIPHVFEFEEDGMVKSETHIFIPSRLEDNQILEIRDPGYRKKLENQPEVLRKQLLEGDWDVAEGMAFTEWRKKIHVCAPFELDDEWPRFTSLDWGYAKPYHVGWYAVDYDGRIYMYRELYGLAQGKTNEGSKENPAVVAAKMLEAETRLDANGKKKKENIRYRAADDAIFGGREDDSKDIAEQFSDAGVYWQRVGKGPKSRIAGKLQMHHRFKWAENAEGDWDGVRPMLVIFNNCIHTIRTVPNMILDDTNPEDVDCWAAGTLISTPDGDVPIEQVQIGDIVDTPIGPRRVIKSHVSGLSETVRVELSNGQILQGTPNHKIGVSNIGLVQLSDLQLNQVLIGRNKGWKRNLLYITALFIHATMGADTIIQTVLTSKKDISRCIGKYGLMLGETFRLIIISITRTTTLTIIGSTTTNVCRQANMQNCTMTNGRSHCSKVGKSGANPIQGANNSGAMLKKCWKKCWNVNLRVSIVDAYLLPNILLKNIVPKPVVKLFKVLKQRVKSVIKRFVSSPTQRSKCEPVHIVAVGHCEERIPVFNLTVEEAHLFYANNVLSSNTDLEDHAYDSLRYSCMSRPMTPREKTSEKTKIQIDKERRIKNKNKPRFV